MATGTGGDRDKVIFYASQGNTKDLRRALQRGANVDTIDRDNRTPLIYASYAGLKRTVDLLLQYGADTSIRDCEGHTASDYASKQGYTKIAAALAAAKSIKTRRPPPPHKHPRHMIDDILKNPPSDALCELCGALERIGGLHKPGVLNHTETAFLAAFNCWGGIQCEGLNGWLGNNSEIETFKQAVDAFRAVGAAKHADALSQVTSLFPGGKLPKDSQAFGYELSDEKHDSFFNKLEKKMKGEDIETLLYSFVKSQAQEFR